MLYNCNIVASNSKIKADVPKSKLRLSKLTHLNLSHNNLKGCKIFKNKANQGTLLTPVLETLYLVNCNFTSQDVNKLALQLPRSLCELDLSLNDGVEFMFISYLASNKFELL